MKLKLNKKKLKNLSNDANALPADLTPRVAGGDPRTSIETWKDCPTVGDCDPHPDRTNYCAPGTEAGCNSYGCMSDEYCGTVTCN